MLLAQLTKNSILFTVLEEDEALLLDVLVVTLVLELVLTVEVLVVLTLDFDEEVGEEVEVVVRRCTAAPNP